MRAALLASKREIPKTRLARIYLRLQKLDRRIDFPVPFRLLEHAEELASHRFGWFSLC